MRGILIIGGQKPPAAYLKKLLRDGHFGGDCVLAGADSGLDWALKNGFKPDYFIGDMDSLRSRRRLARVPPERLFVFPRDKDETDTELGLRVLRQKGCSSLCLWGGGGGRMDHFLAIAALFDRDPGPAEWFTRSEHFWTVDGRWSLGGLQGRRISVFPLGVGPWKMQSRGLQWPLDDLRWNRGDFGISNRVTGDPLEITVSAGRILLVHDLGGGDRP
jgi:thiamine pyrophosphokinase